jgi:hypothetical protein
MLDDSGVTGLYTGYMRNGKRHGKGTIKWSNGQEYNGEWKDDKRHGTGFMSYNMNYSMYDGEWKDDKRHGKG